MHSGTEREVRFDDILLAPRATLMGALSVCVAVGSERPTDMCPPLVVYDARFRVRADEEVNALPEGSAIVERLSDHAIMQGQAHICESIGR